MKKIYLLMMMLIGLFYWTVVLDQAGNRGKPFAILMILIFLLIEIVLIKKIRNEYISPSSRQKRLIDLMSGLEFLIFFGFVIKAISSNVSFFDAEIELRTLLFIMMMSIFILPEAVRQKKTKKSINLKYLAIIVFSYTALDWGLTGLGNYNEVMNLYSSSTVHFSTSNLSMLMYVTWIVNFEFVKKQLSH